MANINVVVIEGNLTKAAELSRWQDGTPYIRFTIANNEYYKNQNGEYDSIASFIDCQCKGAYAETMSKHLLKGRRITVTGRLKQHRWKDEQGLSHSAIVVKVSEISLTPQQKTSAESEAQPFQAVPDVDSQPADMFDEDTSIPF